MFQKCDIHMEDLIFAKLDVIFKAFSMFMANFNALLTIL